MNNRLKKCFALLLMLLLALSVLGFAALAGEGGETPVTPHRHDYDLSTPTYPAEPPTCTAPGHPDGYKCKECDFVMYADDGQSYDALDHNWVQKEVIPPTCEEEGKTVYACSRCTATKDGLFQPVLHHNWSEWTTVTPADRCKTDGLEKHTCSRCQKEETRVIAKAAHTPETVQKKEATCTEPGNEAGTRCSVCGEPISGAQPIAAKGHKFKKTSTEKPTCEEAGYTTYTCSNSGCNETYDDDIKEALGHNIVDDAEVPATCQKEGKTAGRHCDRCNKVFVKQETIPKGDHDWEVVPAIAPTCTEEGRTEGRKCKTCNEVRSESTELPPSGHNYEIQTITQVSCTANGLIRKVCADCNDTQTVVVTATGHKPGDWVYSDNYSCEAGGERWKVCGNCDEIMDREQLEPQGHDWSEEWTIDTPATCTAKGYQSHHCLRCDKKNDVTTIPKAPHSYLDDVTKATFKKNGLVTGVCAVCGEERTPLTVKRVTSVKLSKDSFVCDGKAKKPSVVVKDASGKKLTKGTDYTVTYAAGRKKVGTYSVKVKLTGYYSGSKTLTFTVSLGTVKGVEAKANKKAGTMTLSYAAVKGAKKYVIYCATEKNGSYKKLGSTTKTTYTAKTLEPGKVYYFKVKAYAVNNKDKGVYGPASTVVKAKLGLAAPTGVKATRTGSGSAKVTFDEVKGAKKYVVYGAASKNGDYKKLATVKKTSAALTNVPRGDYYVKVCAVNELTGGLSAAVKVK